MNREQYGLFERWLLCRYGEALRRGDIEWLGWWCVDSNDMRIWSGVEGTEVRRRVRVVQLYMVYRGEEVEAEWVRDGEIRCLCVDVVWYVGE